MRIVRNQQRCGCPLLQTLRPFVGGPIMSLRVNSQLPTPNSQFGSWSFWKLGVCVVLAVSLSSGALAQNMPDPSLINGRAIPAPELQNGTVTVRVVRESIGNN